MQYFPKISMSAIRSNFFSRNPGVGAAKTPWSTKAAPIKWAPLDSPQHPIHDHQEMDPNNPNHQGNYPLSTCGGRITRHKIKKEGPSIGKYFFTCDCTGVDANDKRLNGIMMEVEFLKNRNAMIRCKTIEGMLKKEQIKDAINKQLGLSGIQRPRKFPEFVDAIGDFTDELSDNEGQDYMQAFSDWHCNYVNPPDEGIGDAFVSTADES